MTDITKRIITAAAEIWQDSAFDVVYQHSLFCQIALPRRRPEGKVFKRNYQNGSIRMEAGELWDGLNCGLSSHYLLARSRA